MGINRQNKLSLKACIIGNFSHYIQLIIQALPTDEFSAPTEFCECCVFAVIEGCSFD